MSWEIVDVKRPLAYDRENDQEPEYLPALSPYDPCPRRKDDFENDIVSGRQYNAPNVYSHALNI